jgi:formamidopyrimidine-DNA glycosylase
MRSSVTKIGVQEQAMRELPEVEVLRRDLEREISSKKIKVVEAKSMALLGRYNNRKAFTGQLEGAKVTGVTRKGLNLLLNLDEGRVLVVVLGEGGLLRRTGGKDHGLDDPEVTIVFTQGGSLQFTDDTGTGEMFVVPADGLATALPAIDKLGADPLDEPMAWTTFAELVLRRSTKMKTLLTDPSVLAGIGDVYADEILFHAGLRHDRGSNTLSSQEVRRLYRAVVETLHEAVKYRGTSLGQAPFADLTGKPGEYQDHLAVYGRDGLRSPRSRGPIQRVKFEGRWTYFCETQV